MAYWKNDNHIAVCVADIFFGVLMTVQYSQNLRQCM